MSTENSSPSVFPSPAVGLDLGSQKTMIVAEDGDIVRTDTGSVSRPTLISLSGKKRLFGEEAFAQLSAEGTIALLNLMVGRNIDEINTLSCFSHRKIVVESDEQGRLVANVPRSEGNVKFHVTSLLGMYLAHLNQQISSAYGHQTAFCFPLYPNYSTNAVRAYKEACEIAGIAGERVFTFDAADCLVATYARKIHGLGGAEQVGLIGKKVLLLDMGHIQTTCVIVEFPSEGEDLQVKKVSVAHDNNLGAYHFDLQLFHHFAKHCEEKYKTKIEIHQKRGVRLMAGCERIRKLLSQLNESKITVEHLIDEIDVNFTLKREEMTQICDALLQQFQTLIQEALKQGNVEHSHIAAIEVLGGGVRMPVVQQALHHVLHGEHLPLGAKLDDAALALGAALLYQKQIQAAGAGQVAVGVVDNAAKPSTSEIGLSEAELTELKALEVSLQAADEAVKQVQLAYNQLESFILEMRTAPRRKFGESIDASKLNAILDDYEGWLWDHAEESECQVFVEKLQALEHDVKDICQEFFTKTEEEKRALEAELQMEALRAAQEKAENGEDDDHDNRKLKKADRMRLVNKNKEEGNELFAGGNFRMAMARYHKALTHCTKFFDLNQEDQEEVKTIQIALYNNLATCYSKVDNWDQVLRNCEEALKLNPKALKALFRRSQYYEFKKDYEKALKDLQLCMEYNTSLNEDKLVTKGIDRVKKEMQKLKDKEKKMWGKAFA